MFDLLPTLVIVATLAAVVGVLLSRAPVGRTARAAVLAVALAWVAAVAAAAALGAFGPGTAGPVPVPALVFLAFLGAEFLAWRLLPRFRASLLTIPLPALVGLHAGRIFGLFFVLSYAAGRLPAPFAPVAGWGDVAVGMLAIPAALRAARSGRAPRWLGLWNAAGALDLAVAISLGFLSAPGTPFRLFTGGPGSMAMMGTLPWAFIPTTLVPAYFMIHWVIARKLSPVGGVASPIVRRATAVES